MQTHSLATASSRVLRLVDVHDGVALVVEPDETLAPRLVGVLVVDRPVRRVVPVPKVKVVEKGVSRLMFELDSLHHSILPLTQVSMCCHPWSVGFGGVGDAVVAEGEGEGEAVGTA